LRVALDDDAPGDAELGRQGACRGQLDGPPQTAVANRDAQPVLELGVQRDTGIAIEANEEVHAGPE
jgi:hypothetical protein